MPRNGTKCPNRRMSARGTHHYASSNLKHGARHTYPMLSTKCFVGSCCFHIPSHDVQTCPNNSKFKSDSALLQDTVNHGDLLGHHSKPATRRCQGLIGSRKWMEMAIARAHANSFANFVLLEIWINHSCELLWSPH